MKEKNNTTTYDLSLHSRLPSSPLPFQNADLLDISDPAKKVTQDKLINRLNYLNFIHGDLLVIFRNGQNFRHYFLSAVPQPCTNADFSCILSLDEAADDLNHYEPLWLVVEDGREALLVPVSSWHRNGRLLQIKLPEEALMKTQRSVKRHRCRDVMCEIISEEHSFKAPMIDFTPVAFSMARSETDADAAIPLAPTAKINIFHQDTRVFSGICRLIRGGEPSPDNRMVYAPVEDKIPLFAQRQARNPRRQIHPPFTIRFQHPLFPESIERDIFDVSTSGFSIREDPAQQTLMAGLTIPNIVISYAGVTEMSCKAQVVYRRDDTENRVIQYGLAITDMDVLSYSRLNHLVGVHLDNGARVSTTVNMDALWEFFFDTGFIYGEKYGHLHPNRNTFVETYRKLYQDNPDIARHFTYEKNGRIYGHISMVHAYDPSWVIHHFSARPLESKIPGFLILRQIAHYLNGCYRFQSSRTDYVMTYYRPENKVVSKVFGGFARELNNPQGSSLDLFSYLYVPMASCPQNLPDGWALQKCTADDFSVFKEEYDKRSGGLLWDAFGLHLSPLPLAETFNKSGFFRHYETYCLSSAAGQQAFFIVNQSDMCLNLSDLINSIKIFITNDHRLNWNIVLSAVGKLAACYSENQIPVLVYPSDYLTSQGIPNDKNYELWILKTNPFLEQYTDYMARKFRTKYRDD